MAEVPLKYTADMAQIRQQLSQLSGLTEAEVKKQLASMDRYYKARAKAEAKAASDAAKGGRQVDQAWKGAEQNIGKTKEGLAGLGAALSVVSPEMGRTVQQTSALTGALKSAAAGGPILTGAVVALASALAFGYAAYADYNEAGERAEIISRALTAAEESRQPVIDALTASTLALAVATGQMTEEQAKLQQIASTGMGRYETATKDARTRVEELEKAQTSLTTKVVDFGEKWASLGAVGAAIRGFGTSTAELRQETAVLNSQIAITKGLAQEQIENEQIALVATNDRIAAEKKAAEAARETANAIRDQSRERKAAAAEALDWFIKDEQAARDKQDRDAKAAEDAIAMERHINEIKRQAAQNVADYETELANRKRQQDADNMQAALGALSTTSSAINSMVASQIAATGKASMGMYALSIGVAEADNIANYARGLGLAAAYPPPYNAIVAGAATLAFGAATAALATAEPPAFHDTPGAVYMPSGGAILGAPGDIAIMGRRPEDVKRQADQLPGGSGSGLRVVAVPEYQHWDRFGRDAMRAPGTWTEIKRQTARTPGRR